VPRRRRAVPDDRQAVRRGVDDLGAGQALLEAVEAVGVDGGVAVDERVLELEGRGLDLHARLRAALVVEVRPRLLDERSTSASPPRITSDSVFWLTVPVLSV
jgi:hypothetical protein